MATRGTRLAKTIGMTRDPAKSLRCEVPVFYATTEGQTRRIAERLAEALHGHGFDSRAVDVATRQAAAVDWTHVSGALVGASLHVGGHQRAARRFVREHAGALNGVPSAFFSVSLSAASRNPAEVEEAARIAEWLPASQGWTPAIVASIAGRLAYLEYGFLKRLVIKKIARKEGASTDTSRDWEYTDWAQVDSLAADLAERIRAQAAAVA